MKKCLTLLAQLLPFALFAQITTPANQAVVISQVYAGAGCGTTGCSQYKNDYIELYNRTGGVVTLTGYSVQYASTMGTTWGVHALPATVTLQPGQYYLIAESFNNNGTSALPVTPDATGSLALSGTAGKVALVAGTAALSGACPTSGLVADFIGYGSGTNCFEGTGPSPSPANNNSALLRQVNGRVDANDNAADFVSGAATPRNSSNFFLLPVNLSAFTAVRGAQDVSLQWKTAGQNPLSFVVERSSDGTDFTPLATLPATDAADYSFTDKTPLGSDGYYRLKLLGANGRTTYSQTLLVKASGKGRLQIFPNPATSILTVQFVSRGQEILQVTDAQGRVHKSKTVAASGTVVTTLDVADLAEGVYFLRAGNQYTRFVKH